MVERVDVQESHPQVGDEGYDDDQLMRMGISVNENTKWDSIDPTDMLSRWRELIETSGVSGGLEPHFTTQYQGRFENDTTHNTTYNPTYRYNFGFDLTTPSNVSAISFTDTST